MSRRDLSVLLCPTCDQLHVVHAFCGGEIVACPKIPPGGFQVELPDWAERRYTLARRDVLSALGVEDAPDPASRLEADPPEATRERVEGMRRKIVADENARDFGPARRPSSGPGCDACGAWWLPGANKCPEHRERDDAPRVYPRRPFTFAGTLPEAAFDVPARDALDAFTQAYNATVDELWGAAFATFKGRGG